MEYSLLLVDDETNVANSLSRLLRKDKYKIYTADSGEEALRLLQQYPVNIVISDQRMPGMTGSELLTRVKQKYPEILRIVISGYSDVSAITDAINQGGIYKFLTKPWNNELLRADIREALDFQALRHRNNQLCRLFNNTIEAIVLTDTRCMIKNVNPAFTELTGFAADEVLGKPLGDFIRSSANESVTQGLLASQLGEQWHADLSCRQQNDKELPIWLNFTSIQAPFDETCYAAMFIDISKQKQKEAIIEYQAYHDELTSLPNRRLFINHLELALHQQQRNKQKLAIFFIDLDRFKNINDTLGHKIGDDLLKAFADRLSAVVRKGDTLARLGGDEFIIVLPGLDRVEDCNTVAAKIIEMMKEPFILDGNKIYMSPSIGISSSSDKAESYDLLIQNADQAMYRAKELGGNNYQFFDPNSNRKINSFLEIENDIHDAIESEDFVVFYQPQATPGDGTIRSCEALVRWQHPEKGLLSPAYFIDIAEQTGLIHAVGNYVMQQACQQLSKWRRQYQLPYTMSVNLSPRQFNDRELMANIFRFIKQYQLEPNWLEVEITESMLLDDLQQGIKTLNALRDAGIRVALDDFGTGYSSLSYLKQLPIDTLKIDMRFITELPTDKASVIITTSILKMAKGLGLYTVAEGVETAAQMEFLADLGCDLIQGYYLSRPVCSEELTALALAQPNICHQAPQGVQLQ